MGSEKKGKYWVGFDLGGTKMMAIIMNEDFKILSRIRKKTKGYEGVKLGLDRMMETIKEALVEAKVIIKEIRGVGVGCPGPLDLDKGILIETPNLKWKNVELKSILKKEFDSDVAILNDADAGVYGEYRFGAGKNQRCVIGAFCGTGIGGGCVYEGKIIRGKNSSCMEIGHLPVVPMGPLCGCGKKGCVEAIASRLSIAAAASKAAFRGEAPKLLELAGTDIERIKSTTLYEAIRGGDKAVEKIVKDAAYQTGIALAGAVNLLAPDVIVLGGGLVEAMPDIFVENVKAAINYQAMSSLAANVKVTSAKLGDDAVAMGAAAWIEQL